MPQDFSLCQTLGMGVLTPIVTLSKRSQGAFIVTANALIVGVEPTGLKKYQPEGWYFAFLVGPPGLEPGTKGL